jgi:hypothetical protein
MDGHVGCNWFTTRLLIRGMYGIGVGGHAATDPRPHNPRHLSAQALQGTSVENAPNRILVVGRAVRRQ